MKKMLLKIFLAITMALSLTACGKDSTVKADTVITGTIYTANDNDDLVTGVAIKDGKFIYVGDKESVKTYVGENTKTYNIDEDKLVIPGFIDGHTHITSCVSAKFSDMIVLNSYTSKEEYLTAIKEFVDSHPNQETYSGTGWINGAFPDDNGCPTAEMLDAIESEKPIMLRSVDGHSIWCNTAMMKLAGISADSEDPTGGTIERKADGKTPNGCFRDTAEDIILKAMPAKSVSYYERGIIAAQKYYSALGYTTYEEIVVNEAANTLEAPMVEAYEELDKNDSLTMKVEGGILINNDEDALETLEKAIELKNSTAGGKFEVTTIKIYIDGVVEGKTALLSEPYAFDSSYYGVGRWTTEQDIEKLEKIVEKANEAGLTVHFHTIGDEAVTIALNVIEKAYENIGDKVIDSRNALTHLQIVKSEDIERMNKLNVQAVCNPWGLKAVGYFDEIEVNYLGQERADTEYPVKSFKDNGVNISYATDFSAGDVVNPIESFHVFVTRTTSDDSKDNVQNISEALSRVDCLHQMTAGGAYQLGLEDSLGSIEVGKDANLAILSKNLLEIDSDEIMSTQVISTMCNGAWSYSKNGESVYTNGTYINVVSSNFYDADGSLNLASGDAALTIEKINDAEYKITVEQNNSDSSTKWEMIGSYDDETDSIYYEDGIKTQDGKEIYNDGKGFVRYRDDSIIWLSLKEPETSSMTFFDMQKIIDEVN